MCICMYKQPVACVGPIFRKCMCVNAGEINATQTKWPPMQSQSCRRSRNATMPVPALTNNGHMHTLSEKMGLFSEICS